MNTTAQRAASQSAPFSKYYTEFNTGQDEKCKHISVGMHEAVILLAPTLSHRIEIIIIIIIIIKTSLAGGRESGNGCGWVGRGSSQHGN